MAAPGGVIGRDGNGPAGGRWLLRVFMAGAAEPSRGWRALIGGNNKQKETPRMRIALIGFAAIASLALAACGSPAEKAADQQAEAVTTNADATAKAMDNQAEANKDASVAEAEATEDATRSEADAVKEGGAVQADAIKKEAEGQ